MNKGAEIIARSIIGTDFKTIIVNKKAYTIYPPTIYRLSGAISHLSTVKDAQTTRDVLLSLKDASCYSKALSWFINGDESLEDELKHGTYEECINGLEEAISMIDMAVFLKAVSLARNVSRLAAKPR